MNTKFKFLWHLYKSSLNVNFRNHPIISEKCIKRFHNTFYIAPIFHLQRLLEVLRLSNYLLNILTGMLVFSRKHALLKLKWTKCAECWIILVFDYYFGAECSECRVQNVQNVGYFKENLPC